jgi:integrase/recombinase XerD
MLSVYARHYPPCEQKNPAYRRCRCPKWIQGTTESGEFIRRSAKTRSWEKAQKSVKNLENPQETPSIEPPEPVQSEPDPKRTKIEVAVEIFLNDANSRGLQEPTQQKLKHLCRRQLLDWAKS